MLKQPYHTQRQRKTLWKKLTNPLFLRVTSKNILYALELVNKKSREK